jgi:truncated hemoglobin YjbI
MKRHDLQEELLIEEADAWFEYLEATQAEIGTGRYEEVEPWAWARLNQRLRAVEHKREGLRPAAA